MAILKTMGKKAERKRKTSVLDRRLQATLKELRHSRKPKYTQDDIADIVGEKWSGTQSQIETEGAGSNMKLKESFSRLTRIILMPLGPKENRYGRCWKDAGRIYFSSAEA
jgi:hypothetical protein